MVTSWRECNAILSLASQKSVQIVASRNIVQTLNLDEWAKFDYFRKANVNDLLGIDVAYPVSPQIDRVHQSRLSVQQFIDNYERPAVPCIITGCADKWRARKEWSFESFSKNFGNVLLKCGEDDDGYKVKVKTKYFLKYMYHQRDDSPLYLFDSSFDEKEETRPLCDHYSPPKYFREDLFRLVGEKRRPPYRWFLIGPRRSGTCVHIDPLATSAWNTLLRGRKRWILFPPETSKTLVKGKHHKLPGEDDEAIDYFLKMLPRIKAEGRAVVFKKFEIYRIHTVPWGHDFLTRRLVARSVKYRRYCCCDPKFLRQR